MVAPFIIGAGIAAAGGLLGQLLAGKPRDEAEEIMRQARDEFGRIDPARVKALSMDPKYGGAMDDSLDRVGQQVNQGGMTAVDRAALNESLDDVGRQDRAQRAHIRNSFEARGAGGNSQNMLAQLVNQQGSAQRAQRAGMDTAANAQQRYWQAVKDRFGMANQAQDQRSAIDRWNNQQEADRWQRDFQTQQAKYDVSRDAAASKEREGDRTADMWAGIGGIAGRAFDKWGSKK